MSNIQKINSEQAAHNIATSYVQHYLQTINTSFNIDSPKFYDSIKNSAQIYANVYDTALEHIRNENLKLESN